jgi:hypothetical protein
MVVHLGHDPAHRAVTAGQQHQLGRHGQPLPQGLPLGIAYLHPQTRGTQQGHQVLLRMCFVTGGGIMEQNRFHARVTPGCNSRSSAAAPN